jgi:hypothetical protein
MCSLGAMNSDSTVEHTIHVIHAAHILHCVLRLEPQVQYFLIQAYKPQPASQSLQAYNLSLVLIGGSPISELVRSPFLECFGAPLRRLMQRSAFLGTG